MLKSQFVPEILVTGNKTFGNVDDDVCAPLERFPTQWVCFVTAICVFLLGAALATDMFTHGLGGLCIAKLGENNKD